MKFGTGVGVHKTNYATESFLEIQGEWGFRGENAIVIRQVALAASAITIIIGCSQSMTQ